MLQDVGIAAGSITAIITLAVLVARLKVTRWVWRRLVSEPLTAWHRAQVAHELEPRIAPLHERLSRIEEEFGPNGGKSFRDQVMRRLAAIERTQKQ